MRGFLKENSATLNLLMHFLDWFSIALTSVLASGIYLEEWVLRPNYVPVVLLTFVLSAWLFSIFGLYRVWRGASLFAELRQLLFAWTVVFGCLALMAMLTKTGAEYSRGWMLLWYAIGLFAAGAFRVLVRLVVRYLRHEGFNQRQVIIVGNAQSTKELSSRILEAPWAGFRVVRVFIIGGQNEEGSGTSENFESFLASNQIDQVWIALPLREEERVNEILHNLRNTTADIRYFPDMQGMSLINHSVSEVIGMPVLNLSATPLVGGSLLIKELEDKALSILALVFLSPVFLLVAAGVKLSSPGPVFYRQERVGWNGRPFQMLKFRSMPVGNEKDGVVWGGSRGKETTRFGSFIRRTSIDELPQFVNVLMGEMSIVGPRPERTVFVEQFKNEIPNYMKKHLVKAGITGWAQVNGLRGDTDLRARVEHDIYYIENWTLWLDIKILFMTLYKGMVAENAH